MAFWTGVGKMSISSALVTNNIFQFSHLPGLVPATSGSGMVTATRGYAVATVLAVLHVPGFHVVCKVKGKI